MTCSGAAPIARTVLVGAQNVSHVPETPPSTCSDLPAGRWRFALPDSPDERGASCPVRG